MRLSPRRFAQIVALALVVFAVVFVLVAPTYQGSRSDSSGSTTSYSSTALEVNGPVVLITLAIPLVIALAPLLARRAAWLPISITAAVLLGALTALGVLTIGPFFIPAAVTEIVALALPAVSRRGATA